MDSINYIQKHEALSDPDLSKNKKQGGKTCILYLYISSLSLAESALFWILLAVRTQ